MKSLKSPLFRFLKWSEKYTKTDMIYLIQGSFWINTNTIISSLFAFVLSIAFARYVSKDVYGVYQFLLSIASILGGLTLTGMNAAVIQAVARGFEDVFKKSVSVQLKFSFITFCIGLAVALYYFIQGDYVISLSLIAIAICLPITNSLSTWSAFLSGKKEFRFSFICFQIINILYYGGLVATIFLFPTTVSLIYVSFIINMVANYLVYYWVIKKYKPNDSHEEESTVYGKKLSISNILPLIALSIDNLIVFTYLGPVQLAIYAFASNIPERFSGLLRPISSLASPKLAVRDKEEVTQTLHHKTLRLFLVSLIATLIYIIISPFVFKYLFPQYMSSLVYSQFYILASAFLVTASLPITALQSLRSKYIYKFNIIHPIFSILTIFIGTYYWGIWGTVIAKIITAIFLLVFASYLVRKTN